MHYTYVNVALAAQFCYEVDILTQPKLSVEISKSDFVVLPAAHKVLLRLHVVPDLHVDVRILIIQFAQGPSRDYSIRIVGQGRIQLNPPGTRSILLPLTPDRSRLSRVPAPDSAGE